MPFSSISRIKTHHFKCRPGIYQTLPDHLPRPHGPANSPPIQQHNELEQMALATIATALSMTDHDYKIMLSELHWQRSIMQDVKAFHTETHQMHNLLVFVFMRPNSSLLNFLHLAASFYAPNAPPDLLGKDIGFDGDNTGFQTPTTVLFSPEKPWRWVRKLLHLNDLAFDTHFNLPANQFTLHPAQTGGPFTYDLPQMLLTPPQLVHPLTTSKTTQRLPSSETEPCASTRMLHNYFSTGA